MVYLAIIWYIIFIYILFSLIIKRMQYLSKRQAQNTWIESLKNGYKKIKFRMIILWIILVILISFIFLTFFDNELLWKKWIHISKETLDNNVF